MKYSKRPTSLPDLRRDIRRRLAQYRADLKQFPDESSVAHRMAKMAVSELARIDLVLARCGVRLYGPASPPSVVAGSAATGRDTEGGRE